MWRLFFVYNPSRMSRTLRLNVLGPFDAQWSDGTALEVTGKKIRGLLGYLAVESARPHSREQVAALLWSETGDERARHNLRQALSKIRRSCGPLIASTGDALALDLDLCSVDARDFDGLARSKDVADLERCMALYRDDLLDGLVLREELYDEWLLGAQHQFRRTACDVIERLAVTLADLNRGEEAVDVFNRRIAMDPACEPAHRHLMELLERIGRRSDALRQYEFLTDALSRELGTKPSSETTEVYERIRSGGGRGAPREPIAQASPPVRSEHELPTVAVLPFDNLSGPEDNYFVDGIVEDIITALSHFSSLMVISRGSTFAYRGREVSDRDAAAELNAQFILRGSVRRAGDRVRISVQLLDAHAGSTLWAHRFDREIEDVFLVQDELSSTIVSTLAGRVEAAQLAKARRAPPERLDAYDYVLRGKAHHHRQTPEDTQTAIDLFEHAIEADPTYAQAHAWLACGLGMAMHFRPSEYEELLDQAEVSAKRGLALDASDSECLRILAQIALLRRNLQLAIRHQERYREALDASQYQPAPRVRELAYQVAASSMLADEDEISRQVAALRKSSAVFDIERFVASLPYEDDEDRAALRDALAAVL
jgi:TolB-like protein